MIPSVPSEPSEQAARCRTRRRPCGSGRPRKRAPPGGIVCLEPRHPVRRTTPYLKACGPPAFVAMFPPIWDCSGAPDRARTSARSRGRAASAVPVVHALPRPRSARAPGRTSERDRAGRGRGRRRRRRPHPRRARCHRRAGRSGRRARSTRPEPPQLPRRCLARNGIGTPRDAREVGQVLGRRTVQHGVAELRAQIPLEAHSRIRYAA